MRNSTIRRNKKVLGFVLQLLLTVGAAAMQALPAVKECQSPEQSPDSCIRTDFCSAPTSSSLTSALFPLSAVLSDHKNWGKILNHARKKKVLGKDGVLVVGNAGYERTWQHLCKTAVTRRQGVVLSD